MPKELPHNQTSTKEFISLINENSGKNTNWFFDQYLYVHNLPTLKIRKEKIKNRQFIDIWWENKGFKMPIEILYESMDGKRKKTLALNNSPLRIVIPENSKLIIDPNRWLLFKTN